MKPVVSADDCSGCGLCESIAPDIFQLADDGIARVLEADEYDEAASQEAADSCPSGAISL